MTHNILLRDTRPEVDPLVLVPPTQERLSDEFDARIETLGPRIRVDRLAVLAHFGAGALTVRSRDDGDLGTDGDLVRGERVHRFLRAQDKDTLEEIDATEEADCEAVRMLVRRQARLEAGASCWAHRSYCWARSSKVQTSCRPRVVQQSCAVQAGPT